jgi:uncharacterized membrane protein YedE/YeeE
MVCGMARLSARSIVATMTFCGVAFAIVKLFGTAARTSSMFEGAPFMTLPTLSYTLFLICILAIIWGIYALLIASQSRLSKRPQHNLELFSVFFNAFVFALGLGISGMTLPGKVLGFFDIGGPHWDPSLVCVALFAILPDMLLFQFYLLKLTDKQDPIFSEKWRLPTARDIDARLIIGSVLFGLGWGIAGICPGPAIVNITDMRLEILLFCVAYIGGLSASLKMK